VILNAEDGLADTVLPRLLAAGGDPKRVLALDKVPCEGGERLPVLPLDFPWLRGAIKQVGAALVIVDPIMAFLGSEVNPDRRILASTKSNLAKLPPAQVFALEPAGDGALRVGWTGPSAHTAESLLAVPKDDEEKGAVDEAVEVLREILTAGPVDADQAKKEAPSSQKGMNVLHLLRNAMVAGSLTTCCTC